MRATSKDQGDVRHIFVHEFTVSGAGVRILSNYEADELAHGPGG